MKKIIPVNCVNVFAQITQQATSYSKVLKQHLLLVCLLFMFENAFSQNADLTTIYDRLHSQRSADKFVKDSVVAWQNRLANNGRWPDVNYTITNSVPKAYSPIVHLDRIYAMVLAYTNASATNTLYHNAALLAKIKLALADNLGRKHDAVFGWNNDWYATYIVNPGSYAKSLLMLKGEIPQNELLIYSAQLRDGLKVKNSGGILQFESGGQNLIWVANVTIYKGLIENNSQKVDSAFYYISSTLSYITNSAGEGIKRDGAFHQHGKQVYSAGYGLWFTSDVIYYIELSQNTSYNNNFTAEKKAIFSNLLLNGHQWLSYRSVMDYGAEGRNISRMGSYSVSAIGAWLLDKMAVFDAGNAAKYQSWKINRNGGVSSLTGNKHFWQSDLMVHRGANFFLSTKVPSVRTNGTETMNTENLKGFYLAVGAMNILSSGNEYKDIFPVWDWSRVPGTTAEQSVTYPSAHIFLANNNFAGAVSSGSNGTIAFKATYNGIANNKAYFYMGGSVYCMGAGISATKQNAVLTSINQTLSNGTITLNNGSVGVFTNGATSYNNLQWAHHDNVGYVFPKVGNVTVKNDVQKGAWYDINNLYSTAAHKAIQSKNVFSIWMDHGKTPKNASYHYIVVPSVTVDELTKFSANHGFLIAQNDTNIQAVENSNLKIWSAVFYRAGKVQFSNGLTLQADKAAVVMLEFSSGVYTLSVADPLQNSDQINISINSYLTGPNATYLNGNSTIKIVMPKGEYIGSTVKNNYNTDLIAPTVPTLLKASNTKSVTTELSWTSSSDNV
ncbi:MAG: polysaccharide lyase beta-sandwich domain-containing protein, partial [Bacteroidetes bacterium]|nr:polysaccharide lyase beta-sandwich domain-containing protein [Bacteroidota bacterium]